MQLMVRLPEELAVRFKAAVPPKKRSAFVADLLVKALPVESDPLYQIALAVEQDADITADMADWDTVTGDGLGGCTHETR